ncbi:MAG: zinc-ribbon domain-containing protein [Candidatus Adiutrix sp.]|jgi:predicted Zn finger-like uncharacterized protein|nr:zinc-ribbon domain-containing protein [Candidatus Adiutrix sp.]
MVKLTCPSCQAKLQVPDDHIPAAGGWARCPKCRDRFFLKPGGQAAVDLARPFQEPPTAQASPTRPGRDEASQKLLDRLKDKNRAGQPDKGLEDFEPGEIIVFPAPALSETACQYIGLALLSLPLLAIILVLSWGRTTPAVVSQVSPTALKRLNTEDSPEIIRADLLNIKRDLLRRRRPHIDVDYSGPESRVFKYFMGRLTPPDYCSGITHLEIAASQPTSGFVATGFCQGEAYKLLEMKASWTIWGVRVQFSDYPGQEEFEMTSQPKPPWH